MKTLYTLTYGQDWLYKLAYAALTLYLSFLPLNHGIWTMQQVFGREETFPIMMSLYLGAIAMCVIGFILALCRVGKITALAPSERD